MKKIAFISSCLTRKSLSSHNENNNNNRRSFLSRVSKVIFEGNARKVEEKMILKTLIAQIDELKSSNSHLWLQLEEILNSELFRQPESTSKDERHSRVEHVYENLISSNSNKIEDLLVNELRRDDDCCKEPRPLELEKHGNKVAEKIEKFNKLALRMHENALRKKQTVGRKSSLYPDKLINYLVAKKSKNRTLDKYESTMRIRNSLGIFKKRYSYLRYV